MSDNLYELSSELATINNEIAEAGGDLGEMTQDGSTMLERHLDAITLAVKDKIQSISKWTLNLDGRTEAIDKEIIRLQHKKKMTDNLNKRLQDYIRQSMQRADISKIEYPTFTVAVQKNPPSVEIISEEAVPNSYKTIKQIVTVDKRRILDDLKAGQNVSGCNLINNKTYLRIK